MTAPRLLAGLHEVADRYDALLCDVWGVVHNGRTPFAQGCAALARFKATQAPVVLISNSPRPGEDVVLQLDALGVPRDAWTSVVTSGDATREELRARAPGPAWALGPMRDAPLYDGTGIRFAEVPEEAAFVSCTGLFDDEIETPDDFRERLRTCVDRGLVMVCANPDRIVQRGGKTIFCAGALADVYAEYGGEVVMAGKPSCSDLRPRLCKEVGATARPRASKSPARLLALGDGLRTDVEGANAQGLDVLFTAASGVHAGEVRGADGGAIAGACRGAAGQRRRANATYVMAELAW